MAKQRKIYFYKEFKDPIDVTRFLEEHEDEYTPLSIVPKNNVFVVFFYKKTYY